MGEYAVEDEYLLWERKPREVVIQVVCYIVYALVLMAWYNRSSTLAILTRKKSLEVISKERGEEIRLWRILKCLEHVNGCYV